MLSIALPAVIALVGASLLVGFYDKGGKIPGAAYGRLLTDRAINRQRGGEVIAFVGWAIPMGMAVIGAMVAVINALNA